MVNGIMIVVSFFTAFLAVLWYVNSDFYNPKR